MCGLPRLAILNNNVYFVPYIFKALSNNRYTAFYEYTNTHKLERANPISFLLVDMNDSTK